MISLCMIVKDEQDNLPQCLGSVCDWVDEIVIVDTGSTDNTKVIAQEFNAKVIDFPWTDSFSEARNKSLEHATGDFILVLDADEYLTEEMGPRLRQLEKLESDVLPLYQLRITNPSGPIQERHLVEHYAVRFFPNHTSLWYKGLIHEQLDVEALDQPYRVYTVTDFVITHEGYTEEAILAKNKRERNDRLLRSALAQEPENPFHWFNFGIAQSIEGNKRSALNAFLRALDLANNDQPPSYIQSCYIYAVTVALELEQVKLALDLCTAARGLCQSSPD
jgi:glycosyltransferase involved in cell wall biosynthesis